MRSLEQEAQIKINPLVKQKLIIQNKTLHKQVFELQQKVNEILSKKNISAYSKSSKIQQTSEIINFYIEQTKQQQRQIKKLKEKLYFLKSSNIQQNSQYVNKEENQLLFLIKQKDNLTDEKSILMDLVKDKNSFLVKNTGLQSHKKNLQDQYSSTRKQNKDHIINISQLQKQIRKYHFANQTMKGVLKQALSSSKSLQPHKQVNFPYEYDSCTNQTLLIQNQIKKIQQQWKVQIDTLDQEYFGLSSINKGKKIQINKLEKEINLWKARANSLRDQEIIAIDRNRLTQLGTKTNIFIPQSPKFNILGNHSIIDQINSNKSVKANQNRMKNRQNSHRNYQNKQKLIQLLQMKKNSSFSDHKIVKIDKSNQIKVIATQKIDKVQQYMKVKIKNIENKQSIKQSQINRKNSNKQQIKSVKPILKQIDNKQKISQQKKQIQNDKKIILTQKIKNKKDKTIEKTQGKQAQQKSTNQIIKNNIKPQIEAHIIKKSNNVAIVSKQLKCQQSNQKFNKQVKLKSQSNKFKQQIKKVEVIKQQINKQIKQVKQKIQVVQPQKFVNQQNRKATKPKKQRTIKNEIDNHKAIKNEIDNHKELKQSISLKQSINIKQKIPPKTNKIQQVNLNKQSIQRKSIEQNKNSILKQDLIIPKENSQQKLIKFEIKLQNKAKTIDQQNSPLTIQTQYKPYLIVRKKPAKSILNESTLKQTQKNSIGVGIQK